MSRWTRLQNVFRRSSIDREIDEELASHIEEAIENGRDPDEAKRAFGSLLRKREESRDFRVHHWLDSLRADFIFASRQLLKNRVSSGTAILSLALAIGSCTVAFRLMDALLLRPLPVAHPEQLSFITWEALDRDGKVASADDFEYPLYRILRDSVRGQAEVMAVGYSGKIDVTYGSDSDLEKAYRQYVSGSMFTSFGIKPALGRVLLPGDDVKPGAHPYVVLSYDYWNRRFGKDPKVIGRRLRMDDVPHEIVGVAERGFTGTETGTLTDLFVPTMMNARAIDNENWSWFRTWVRILPGGSAESVRARLQISLTRYRQERVKELKRYMPADRADYFVKSPIQFHSAAAGVSALQKEYRLSLVVLACIVALVLLIACANVASLLTAQAAVRSREMALRMSIGAGRSRLLQLMLAESLLIAVLASAIGQIFAWWIAPIVVKMIDSRGEPVRLLLATDWRVIAFGLALAFIIAVLFGIVPALRASSVQPVNALKGTGTPHSRHRFLNGLVAVQVAFCFVVLFVAGLFLTTFIRISEQPTGFNAEGVIALETIAKGERKSAQWLQIADQIRETKGVKATALASWPLMSGNAWGSMVLVHGQRVPNNPYFLSVSPEWFSTMQIPITAGRTFLASESDPQVAIINETFNRAYFGGEAVGKTFDWTKGKTNARVTVVGVVQDSRYRDMREPMRATAYVPFPKIDAAGQDRSIDSATFIVRTDSEKPSVYVGGLRRFIAAARPGYHVNNVYSQEELVQRHTLRERLLAILSLFFAAVALLLAIVGLYGVLNYGVIQRQRELGIRMALGAPARRVATHVAANIALMLICGLLVGVAAAIASRRGLETLLFAVKVTEPAIIAVPLTVILMAAALASIPPIWRAIRIDPAVTLRSE